MLGYLVFDCLELPKKLLRFERWDWDRKQFI
jgi:hypothetical protein